MEIDALPYVDKDYDKDEVLRQQVQALIEAESRSTKAQAPKKKNSASEHEAFVAHVPDVSTFQSRTPLLEKERIRLAQGEKLAAIDLDRYNLDRYAIDDASDISLDAVRDAVQNMKVQIEHQKTRALNMELLGQYGVDAWKLRGLDAEETLAQIENQIAKTKAMTTQVNRDRKREHVAAKKQLDALEQEWIGLTLQTNIACQQLAADIQ